MTGLTSRRRADSTGRGRSTSAPPAVSSSSSWPEAHSPGDTAAACLGRLVSPWLPPNEASRVRPTATTHPLPARQDAGSSGPEIDWCGRGERLGPDLVHVESSGRLALDDPSGAYDRVRVVDSFAAMADPEHDGSAW